MNTFLKPFILAAAVVLCLSIAPVSAQEEDDLDPLGNVIADMQSAGGRLAKLLTDKPTQQKQLDAVEKLDALIKLLEQRRNRGQGNGGLPEEPLPDSMIVGGPGGSGPMHAARRNGNAWGNLPAHKREQILQSMTEGFPAHYQQILERYYRRLAEEKPVGGDAEEGAGGASAPAKSKADAAPVAPKKS
jgi:hypothetical protein